MEARRIDCDEEGKLDELHGEYLLLQDEEEASRLADELAPDDCEIMMQSRSALLQGLYLALPPSSPDATTTFDNLPEEVIATIFAFLDRGSLLRAAATCHRWNRIASDDALWRPLYFLPKHQHNNTAEVDVEAGDAQHEQLMPHTPPSSLQPFFLHAPTHSWRAAEAWQRARDDQWRALVADRDREAEALHARLQRAEEDVYALTVCCEGLEAEQALRFEAELALRGARAELEDTSYELMGRTHRLEEKTEEAARLARALVVAEKGREEEKRRADALEREARALRERCETAERSLDLAAQRWVKEKKTREELLDLLGREQRSRSDLTRETIAALFKQLLAPSSSSSLPPSSSTSRSAPSSSSSAPSSSSSSSATLSTSLPPPSALLSRHGPGKSAAAAGRAINGATAPQHGNPATLASSTSPPKASLFPKGQTKCNF
jgi:hypothetical protein